MKPRCRSARRSFRSCGPTTRPENCSRSRSLPRVRKPWGRCFTRTRCRRRARSRSDVKLTAVDMLSLSGHKLHGPKGVGALYVKKGGKIFGVVAGRQAGARPARRDGKRARHRRAGHRRQAGAGGRDHTRGHGVARPVAAGAHRGHPAVAINGDGDRLPNTSTSPSPSADGEALLHSSTRSASPPPRARPVPRGRWSRAMCCAPCSVPRSTCKARCAFRCRARPRKPRSTPFCNVSALLSPRCAGKSPLWAELCQKTA